MEWRGHCGLLFPSKLFWSGPDNESIYFTYNSNNYHNDIKRDRYSGDSNYKLTSEQFIQCLNEQDTYKYSI